MLSAISLMAHPVRKEFNREKCGFDHMPADDFVKSQWQSRTKSPAYLIYRWLIALFFTAVVIETMIDPDLADHFWLYFIYMTNWGIWLCMLTNVLGAALVTIWHFHPEYADNMLNVKSLTSPFRCYWAMHITTLVLSVMITIIYWTLLYNAAENTLNATNVLTHAFNSICMFVDLLIVAHPLRLLHVFLPILFGVVYAIFSLIYQLNGGMNLKGKPYIYHVLDWREPLNALVTVIGVLMLTFGVYLVLFTIYKLRCLLYRRINNASFVLPTTDRTRRQHEKDGSVGNASCANGRGIQHAPSGISMVLSNYGGCKNEAFSRSDEFISRKV